jgi:hypothetical protein
LHDGVEAELLCMLTKGLAGVLLLFQHQPSRESSGHSDRSLHPQSSKKYGAHAKQVMCLLPALIYLQAAAPGKGSQAGSSSSSDAPQPDREFGVRVGQLGRGFII